MAETMQKLNTMGQVPQAQIKMPPNMLVMGWIGFDVEMDLLFFNNTIYFL